MSSNRRGSRSRSVLLGTMLGIAFPFSATQAQDSTPDEDAQKKEARVTVVVHDVKLLAEDKDPRAAEVDEKVTEDTSVRTGEASRSELTFLDLTIERLGSNTIFSFNKAGRSIQLNSGSILVRVPKNSGGASLKTTACSVAITGTVLILEVKKDGRNTLAVFNGGAKMSLNKYPQESMFARGGQLLNVPPDAKKMPKPINIDVNRTVKAHPLFANFPPLPDEDDLYSDKHKSGKSPNSSASSPPIVSNPTGPAPSGPVAPAGPIVDPNGNVPPTGGIGPIDTGPIDTPTHHRHRDGDKPDRNKRGDGDKPDHNKRGDGDKPDHDKKTGGRNKNVGNKGNGKGAGGPVANPGGVPVGANANNAAGNKAIGQPANVAQPRRRIIRKKHDAVVP